MADLTVSSAIDTFMQATTVQGAADALSARGADIASAATLDLSAATGSFLDVTGTTTITAITLGDGKTRMTRFTGALTITHGASLILPGSTNISTKAGDIAFWAGYAAGVVRCTGYMPAAVTEQISYLTVNAVNATTSAADTGFTFELEANSHYIIRGFAKIGCSSTGGVYFGVVSPSGATHIANFAGTNSGPTAWSRHWVTADGLATSTPLCTVNTAFGTADINADVVTTNAGTYKFTFAAAVGSQTATVYSALAWARCTKL